MKFPYLNLSFTLTPDFNSALRYVDPTLSLRCVWDWLNVSWSVFFLYNYLIYLAYIRKTEYRCEGMCFSIQWPGAISSQLSDAPGFFDGLQCLISHYTRLVLHCLVFRIFYTNKILLVVRKQIWCLITKLCNFSKFITYSGCCRWTSCPYVEIKAGVNVWHTQEA